MSVQKLILSKRILFTLFKTSGYAQCKYVFNYVCKNFDCINLQMCNFYFDISICYQFTYLNSMRKFEVSTVTVTYLKFAIVKVTLNCSMQKVYCHDCLVIVF